MCKVRDTESEMRYKNVFLLLSKNVSKNNFIKRFGQSIYKYFKSWSSYYTLNIFWKDSGQIGLVWYGRRAWDKFFIFQMTGIYVLLFFTLRLNQPSSGIFFDIFPNSDSLSFRKRVANCKIIKPKFLITCFKITKMWQLSSLLRSCWHCRLVYIVIISLP